MIRYHSGQKESHWISKQLSKLRRRNPAYTKSTDKANGLLEQQELKDSKTVCGPFGSTVFVVYHII